MSKSARSKSDKAPLAFHSVLFAAYPVLFLASHNFAEVSLDMLILPLILSMAVFALIYFGLKALLKNGPKAAIFTTVVALLFYFLKPLLEAKGAVMLFGHNLFSDKIVIPLVILLAVAVIVLVFRTKRDLVTPTLVLNVVAVALVIMPVMDMVRYMSSSESKKGVTEAGQAAKARSASQDSIDRCLSSAKGSSPEEYPDVYYVILDTYAGADFMKAKYKFGNEEFLGFLESKGFQRPAHSRSNFLLTYLSLTSSLNMEFITWFEDAIGAGSKDRRLPHSMITDNRVSRFFKSKGYEMTQFKSGWSPTDKSPNADHMRSSSMLNEFTITLLSSTIIWDRIEAPVMYSTRRESILYTLKGIGEVPRNGKKPKFVFAHVLSPHPPYYLGSGKDLPYWRLGDTRVWKFKPAYVDEVKQLNIRLEKMVTSILARSKRPPIIILQGDHGTLAFSDFAHMDTALFQERPYVLNSILLPDAGGKKVVLPEDITPVNTFRFILNNYFGGSCELLPDKTFASRYSIPYRFTDITEIAKAAPWAQE